MHVTVFLITSGPTQRQNFWEARCNLIHPPVPEQMPAVWELRTLMPSSNGNIHWQGTTTGMFNIYMAGALKHPHQQAWCCYCKHCRFTHVCIALNDTALTQRVHTLNDTIGGDKWTGQANKTGTILFSTINWSQISPLDHAGPANSSLSFCNWCLKITFYRKFRHKKGLVCWKACPRFANSSAVLTEDVTSPCQCCLTYSHGYSLKCNWPKLPS